MGKKAGSESTPTVWQLWLHVFISEMGMATVSTYRVSVLVKEASLLAEVTFCVSYSAGIRGEALGNAQVFQEAAWGSGV